MCGVCVGVYRGVGTLICIRLWSHYGGVDVDVHVSVTFSRSHGNFRIVSVSA